MKTSNKLKVCLTVVIFLLLPFTDITRPFQGVFLQKAMGSTSELLQIKKLNNYDLLYDLIIIPKQAEDKTALVNMVTRINRIDRPVLQLLVNQGVKVRLFEGNLTDEPLLYYLKWNKPRGWKSDVTWEDVPGSGGSWLVSAKIGASKPGNGHGSFNLELHEIGHTVYKLLLTSPMYAKSIQTAWQQETSLMFPEKNYFLNYSSEYFAEMFSYYYFSEESAKRIKEITPLTYQLFKELHTLNIHSIKRNYY